MSSQFIDNLRKEVDLLTQDMMYAKNQITIETLNQAIGSKLEQISKLKDIIEGG